MMKKTCRRIIILPCLLAVTACGAEQESIEQWMQHAGKDVHGKVEPLPPVQPYQPHPFQGAAPGSPFDPGRLQLARNKIKGMLNSNRPREVLENYELSQLKLTGTLRLNNRYFGLVQTPDGNVHHVQPGNFVGPNFGIVRKVSETEVVLEETVENINGEWVQQKNTLYLLQQEQGAKP
ncbi:pilus assembly protein PilP [Vogesella fluminis]|uniref:Pilus assembly protein PilP n=1 Tax=Vogesella fluminis TaxID=1069161 RepID=A0ABQ3H6J6_9NEIS|nr:pilus assembly protein PilP [Vogesella fluminis]GHD71276.1 pilus assembly protein PilP [Vogesella fluminis]